MSFGTTDQENLLAILAFDDEPGGCVVASQMLPADAWDTHYGKVYAKLVSFIARFGGAPCDTTFDIIEQLAAAHPDAAEAYHSIYRSMVSTWESGLKRDYVYSRARLFGRHSRLRQGIGEALGHLKSIDEDSIARAEKSLEKARRENIEVLDMGISTHDAAGVAAAATERPDAPFLTGIDEFDAEALGPARKELFLLAGGYGTGKSFGLMEMGLSANLLSRAKVLHLSLEMRAEKVMRRVVQRLFGYGNKAQSLRYATFARGPGGGLSELDFRSLDVLGLYDEGAATDIEQRADGLQNRPEYIVKSFPSGQLTLPQLEAFLDYLYGQSGFVPDVIVLDYLQIMKILSAQHKREELGRIAVELRGLADVRNCAIVSALQLNREGIKHAMARGANISEDISAAHTADRLIIYNQSEIEKRLGLARLWVDKGREAPDGWELLISQAYGAAQYCIDSIRMDTTYNDILERLESQGMAA